MRALPFRIAIPIFLTAICLEAQWPDRLYPFRELTDEMRDKIDLKDGSVEDWLEVLGEPTLTPLDFATAPYWEGYNPSSYDFRIWLAWQDGTDHLFVAAEIVDDVFVKVYDTYDITYVPGDACVWFYVDGDKSGGTLLNKERGRGHDLTQAQTYIAFAGLYANGSHVNLFSVSYFLADWAHQLPYSDGGGAIIDSQPIHAVVEFFTPFDRFIWEDPEQSVIADLFAGKTIGFAIRMLDSDTDPLGAHRVHDLLGPDASFGENFLSDYYPKLFWESDLWAREILLGADDRTDGTVVESVSWARIKASLSE